MAIQPRFGQLFTVRLTPENEAEEHGFYSPPDAAACLTAILSNYPAGLIQRGGQDIFVGVDEIPGQTVVRIATGTSSSEPAKKRDRQILDHLKGIVKDYSFKREAVTSAAHGEAGRFGDGFPDAAAGAVKVVTDIDPETGSPVFHRYTHDGKRYLGASEDAITA